MERIFEGFMELKNVVSSFQAIITERIYEIDLQVTAIEVVLAREKGSTILSVGEAPMGATTRDSLEEAAIRAAPIEVTTIASPLEATIKESPVVATTAATLVEIFTWEALVVASIRKPLWSPP